LQNALLNLALNARDAMPRGGRLRVEIARTHLDPDYVQMYPQIRLGDYVLISVSDTGVGMTEEVKQRAFDPFFTTKGVGAGTGLGLSMVYGFARQSGGHVQLYSELDEGTTVRLFLPAANPVSVPDAGNVDPVPAAKPSADECILVVEDDARVRRVVVARLEEEGYHVIQAADGKEALSLVAAHPEIRLLFTDIIMPGGMFGDELAREARILRPSLKVLFTSGYAEPSLVFSLGTGTALVNPEAAAAAVAQGRPAIVEQQEDAAFRTALADEGLAPREAGAISGVNYSEGKAVTRRLYRGEPQAQASPTAGDADEVAP